MGSMAKAEPNLGRTRSVAAGNPSDQENQPAQVTHEGGLDGLNGSSTFLRQSEESFLISSGSPTGCSVRWRRVCALGLILAAAAVAPMSGHSWAVQRETRAEKEANLKKQAMGGLFRKWTFEQDRPDEIPAGFVALSSGGGPPGFWVVQTDATAPSPPHMVSVSSGCGSLNCYHLLLARDMEYEYPDLTVRFRASEGAGAIGGLAFGAKDAENFYAAMVDLQGLTVSVVRVVTGQATTLSQHSVSPKPVAWHTLRVQRNTIISKDFIEIFLDGSLVLSVEDQMLGLGMVGLASNGNSSLFFDALHAVPLFSHRPLSPPPAY